MHEDFALGTRFFTHGLVFVLCYSLFPIMLFLRLYRVSRKLEWHLFYSNYLRYYIVLVIGLTSLVHYGNILVSGFRIFIVLLLSYLFFILRNSQSGFGIDKYYSEKLVSRVPS